MLFVCFSYLSIIPLHLVKILCLCHQTRGIMYIMYPGCPSVCGCMHTSFRPSHNVKVFFRCSFLKIDKKALSSPFPSVWSLRSNVLKQQLRWRVLLSIFGVFCPGSRFHEKALECFTQYSSRIDNVFILCIQFVQYTVIMLIHVFLLT